LSLEARYCFLSLSLRIPIQAGHLKAVKETVALRKPDSASAVSDILMPVVLGHTDRMARMTAKFPVA
jgi:hypothetical protein